MSDIDHVSSVARLALETPDPIIILGDINKDVPNLEKIMENLPQPNIPIKLHNHIEEPELLLDHTDTFKVKSARNIRRENDRKKNKLKRKYR